jgi:hypothetical protein
MSESSSAVSTKPSTTEATAPKSAPKKRLIILAVSQVSRVGKSTVCATLLLEKLGGTIFSVEGRNQDASQYGVEVQKFQPAEIQKLRTATMLNRGHSIIDVGASKYDEFIKQVVTAQMTKVFDYVVVTTDPSNRAIEETISTFETLRSIGFDLKKVRVVFNRTDPGKEVEDQFAPVFAYAHDYQDLTLNKACALPDNQLFDEMRNHGISWQTALRDTTDYQPQIDHLTDAGKFEEAQQMAALQLVTELASAAKHWIDLAYPALNIPARNGTA